LSSLTVTFNKTVIVSAEDLVLTNLGVHASEDDDAIIDLADAQLDPRGNAIVITLPRQLPDGVYSLEILSTVVDLDGAALDGNADGTGGDAFAFSGNPQNRFYQLTGDWNGDGGVSIFDFPTFSYWFGQSLPTAPEYVDINGDQGISIFDFGGFAARFGSSIAYAEPPLAPPALVPSLVHRSLGRQRPTAMERPVASERLASAPAMQPAPSSVRPSNDPRRHTLRRIEQREWVELEESLDDFVPGLPR
jgi:hypothetical protein